ncbi:Lrp/AsnC family transcriptional regulator [Candidatus Woesearchaeota archaeon]|nr:Lrp/AsnC family transcriptional regulator [Candidatus Woesearchaeota archaeon]
MNKKELLIIANLRKNARESLTMMSKKTAIPISTIYERLKSYEGKIITRYTSLVDFSQMGFTIRATIFLKVKREFRDRLKEHLLLSKSLNSVYRVNNGYDFMLDGIFKEVKDVEVFLERLDNDFGVEDTYVSYIIDEIKREDFMSSPEYLKLFFNF